MTIESQMPHTTELSLGTPIAPHLVLSAVLGRGGMATVYEAYHARLRASVAVKVSALCGEDSEWAARRLVREARLCARLDYPQFPRVYDISELEDGRPYFVMEKVTGPTLEDYLADEGRLRVPSAIQVALELLRALDVAHACGIVHRDVKPGNVILQVSGGRIRSIRLIDFGVAHLRVRDEEDRGLELAQAIPHEVLGTPGYMAPEQARGQGVDPRADLYAMGVVLYEMLAGCEPFEPGAEDGPVELMRRMANEPLPDVREWAPQCPKALAAWIARATDLQPLRRFESAAQASRELARVRCTTATTPASSRAVASTPPRAKRVASEGRVRAWATAAGVAAAAAGLVWFQAFDAAPGEPPWTASVSAPAQPQPSAWSPPDQEGLPLAPRAAQPRELPESIAAAPSAPAPAGPASLAPENLTRASGESPARAPAEPPERKRERHAEAERELQAEDRAHHDRDHRRRASEPAPKASELIREFLNEVRSVAADLRQPVPPLPETAELEPALPEPDEARVIPPNPY